MSGVEGRLGAVASSLLVLLGLCEPWVLPQDRPRFRTATDLVVLDVTVFGRDGRPVSGLGREAFAVFEDGEPQRIETFSEIRLSGERRSIAPWVSHAPWETVRNDDLAEGRVLVLLLDDVVPMPYRTRQSVEAHAKQVIEGLGPNDLAAVVYLANRRAGQEFTRDRGLLDAAVARYRPAASAEGALAMLAPRMVVDTIRELAEGLSEIHGHRKAIVYISMGPAVDLGENVGRVAPSADDHDVTGRTQELVGRLQGAFDAARRANINVYCIDPVGLSPSNVRASREFLQTLSGNTGGFTLTQTNDPRPGIVRLLEENAAYYLIGYAPANARRAGRYRQVEVRLTRPGLTARSRAGYVEPRGGGSAEPVPAPAGLSEVLGGFLPRVEVPLQVTAAPVSMAGRAEATVVIVARLLPTAAAQEPEETHPAFGDESVEVQVNAYRMTGDLAATAHDRVPAGRRADDGSDRGLERALRIELRPGRYHLRLAARRAGRMGSAYLDVEVPDFGRAAVSLSGAVLSLAGADRGAPIGGVGELGAIRPTACREFRPTERVAVYTEVHQGGSGALRPVGLTATVLDARGVTRFRSVERREPAALERGRAMVWRLGLPLAPLERGSHLLILEATSGRHAARREVRFEVIGPVSDAGG